MAGDELTGASTFRLEEGLDTGPVFGIVTEPIGPRDTAGDLLGRLAVSGAGLLVATLDGIEAGTLVAEPQPADGISLAPRIETADARVDWSLPALRGRPPGPRRHPGARRLDDVARRPAPARPGRAGRRRRPRARARSAPGPTACSSAPAAAPSGSGEVQPAGKRMLPAADWARGARPAAGERMGA